MSWVHPSSTFPHTYFLASHKGCVFLLHDMVQVCNIVIFCQDGYLRCLDVTNDNVKLLDSYNVGVPITSIDFSTNWSHLNIGSDQGSMYTYDVNAPGKVNLVMNEHNGNFVGVQSLAPGLDYVVVSIQCILLS